MAPPPACLQRDSQQMSVQMLHLPSREGVPLSCDMKMVIEYYSR